VGTSALVLSTLPLLILIDLGSELAFLAVISSLFFSLEHKSNLDLSIYH